jgi:hypothetical protein
MTNIWVKDTNGNKCSSEYFGTVEAAQKALDSLKGCKNCTNCSGCSGCSWCSDCSRCSDCSWCSDCSDCSRCSDCSWCSDCSGCSGCSGCSRCSDNAGTDFVNPPAVPVISDIHRTVFEAASNPASLDMSTWHTCENTHCWAGWVVTLAGDEGRKLEAFFNTSLAAMKILDASSPLRVSPVWFFGTNTKALGHMKKLAEQESALQSTEAM